MDDELREAERRGDEERIAALRRRAGLPPADVEPLLPSLRLALDELVAARAESDRIRAQDRWGEAALDDALIAAEERLDALGEALIGSTPVAAAALEWLALAELPPGGAQRREALQQLAWLDDPAILERLTPSPDHEVHEPMLQRLVSPQAEPPAWAGPAARAAFEGCQVADARGEHLELLARLDADGSIAHFERHAADDAEDVREAAVSGLLAAGGAEVLDALARVALLPGVGATTMLWDRLLELDRGRGLAIAAACVARPACGGWARREATRQLLLEDRPRAWSALAEATRLASADFEPWRWLVELDLPRAMALAAERVAHDWPESPESERAPLQAALDALVRCADPRAEAILLRERARPGDRGAWAAERLLAWRQIRTGAWRGGWED